MTDKKSESELIEVGQGGFVAKTFDDQWKIACAFHKSKTLPKHYDTVEKVFAGIQVANELGLPLIMGMSKTYIVNGVPNIWGDLPLALCRQRGILAMFEEYPIDNKGVKICEKNGNILSDCYGYICRAQRVGCNEIVEDSFTMKDAERAGLTNKSTGLYKKFPKNMCKYKARALVLKNVGADVLNGVDIVEHRHHVSDPKEIRIVEDESDPIDFEVSETLLRSATNHEELMIIYSEKFCDEERLKFRDLSRELSDKFDLDIIAEDLDLKKDDMPDVESFVAEKLKED